MNSASTDVLVVGAGLIGASIAWRLSQAGARVTLADAGTLGGEASSAGAGMLTLGGEFHEPSVWLDLGIEGLPLYASFVEELRSETGLPIDFRTCGSLQIDAREGLAEFHRSAGITVEQAPEGLFYPEDGLVDPVDLLRALRCACERRRVRILEHNPLDEIESGDRAAVVIAAGAWSGSLQVRCRKQTVPLPGTEPVKGHLIGFQLGAGTLGPTLHSGHTYVLQRANGFTIAGSDEEAVGFDRSVNPAICRDIHARAARLLPALEREEPSKSWIGFRPRPAGCGGPHIGLVEGTNVWLAYGHYRNGILLAPLTAQRVAGGITRSCA